MEWTNLAQLSSDSHAVSYKPKCEKMARTDAPDDSVIFNPSYSTRFETVNRTKNYLVI